MNNLKCNQSWFKKWRAKKKTKLDNLLSSSSSSDSSNHHHPFLTVNPIELKVSISVHFFFNFTQSRYKQWIPIHHFKQNHYTIHHHHKQHNIEPYDSWKGKVSILKKNEKKNEQNWFFNIYSSQQTQYWLDKHMTRRDIQSLSGYWLFYWFWFMFK